MASDASFWIKFLRESDLSIDNNTLLKYATTLTNRFTTIEELLSTDENELMNIGIINQLHLACLIKQAHLLDDKENLPLTRQSAGNFQFNNKRKRFIDNLASRCVTENWLGTNQSTPLNPKSKCNLSPALLSRISFNDHSTYDEITTINKKCHFEHTIETPKRILKIDNNEKMKTLIESCPKIISPTSAHGMRAVKSLSDTISLQKKVIVGSDRLKRLALSRSLFKRQTALITKRVSNITNKLMNPFAKMTIKNDSKSIDNVKITSNQIVIENLIKRTQEMEEQEPKERRKIQILSLNNEIQRSTDFICQEDEEETKHSVRPIQTLANRRFKLGATTTFLTRSLANHGHIE